MIKTNQKTIRNKKIKNKAGGDSNESRFYTTTKELRTRKNMIIPGIGINGHLILEQAWNDISKKKDAIRVTLFIRHKKIGHIICQREDFEQGVAFMAQGDELLKYTAPTPYEDDLKTLEQKSKEIN